MDNSCWQPIKTAPLSGDGEHKWYICLWREPENLTGFGIGITWTKDEDELQQVIKEGSILWAPLPKQ